MKLAEVRHSPPRECRDHYELSTMPSTMSRARAADADAYRVDDDLGVIAQARLIVLDWEIRGSRDVAVSTQVALDEVPIPANVPSTVDESKRAHASGPLGIRDMNTILAQTG